MFFDATGRNDWNSAQPESSRSFFYPSLGSSVVVSELVKMPTVIDMFKLRGSWTLFKNAFDPFAINKTFSTTTSAWNTLNSASYPSKLIGEHLLPSTQRTGKLVQQATYWVNDYISMLHIMISTITTDR
ncbi:hypothetical protein [Pedobacter panaciterrae]